MKIYTDKPYILPPGHIPVDDPVEADAVVAFTPELLRNGMIIRDKPVLLVAKRTPLSVAAMGLEINLVNISDLPTVLSDDLPQKLAKDKQDTPVIRESLRAMEKTAVPEQDWTTESVSRQIYDEPVIPERIKKHETAGPLPSREMKFHMPTGIIEKLYISYSPGTNVGKTFTASNMAAWLADQGLPTVLVDMDSVNSGTWEMLRMREMFGPPRRTLAHWDGTEEDILAMAEEHEHPEVKNLHVLLRGDTRDPEKITAALYALAKRFNVVVDTSNDIELPHIASALSHADKIFFIGTLTLKVQSRFSQMYSNARQLAAGSQMILAVNRVGLDDNDKSLKPVDLARQFGFRNYHVVHEDRKARLMAEKKKTLPLFVNSKVSAELKAMFAKEFGFTDLQEKKSGLFNGLFKRRDA
ncbi:CobQ/CobB/MinD/ParA nucleotide binding domain protein [Pelotomaculum schinkii]|uniref:CobQ/CobB/MinD/ParA nucleotide binding domain protein n=1 Tax=Pelotomaculum schinkii TaxID=78350 RepID=A0A4Y7R6Z1_9FIRM|nr:hypothetical protein [Pelotomaculum schinkii]TEB04718.1 CobQ/CobB/MinD/ParA nucleotide binding domain protein [Pelotomaculum schinkii]